MSLFKQLVANSTQFSRDVQCPFPLVSNLLETLGKEGEEVQREIELQAKATRVIISREVEQFATKFVQFKKAHGTDEEKTIYKNMSEDDFFDRLLKKRPLVFFTPRDMYLLRGGGEGVGWKNIPLQEYMSYDEICFSALIGVSVPTFFINNGGRQNCGTVAPPGTYERMGVYVAVVGARFEKADDMESQFMLVRPACTEAVGYGKDGVNGTKRPWLDLWAQLYGVDYFPSYREVEEEAKGASDKYLRVRSGFLNIPLYKRRIRFVLEPFVLDANDRARACGKKAYLHVVGLGLGVWMVDERQGKLMLEVYADILRGRRVEHIADMDFSFFPPDCQSMGNVPHNGTFTENGNHIRVRFSKRNPADKLTDPDRLLVAMYPWDGNSFPGNEYWLGQLAASGDPAAASCSTIGELQNPYVNPYLQGANRFNGTN